jgi:hypothetical protein
MIKSIATQEAAITYKEKADGNHLLFFDPPWESIDAYSYMAESKNVLAFADGFRVGDIVNIFGAPSWVFCWDCVTSWYTPNRPLRRAKYAVWYGDISMYRPDGYLQPWAKKNEPRIVKNSRGVHQYCPAPGRMLSDVFSEPITKLHGSGGHKHSKPIDWVTQLIANTRPENGFVLDPFCGGGASAVACERIGADWYGGDIDPDCVQYTLDAVAYESQRAGMTDAMQEILDLAGTALPRS